MQSDRVPENDAETSQYADIKITALISVPMCGWNPHWGSVAEALRPFHIPIRLGFGAYWHQTMSNMIEDCVDEGLDWVLTLDYDSMFTASDLDQLIRRFGQNGHIDALAALQCKRSTEELPLFTVAGQNYVDVGHDPIKVTTAHFGMTLIRLDALKKVSKPWFVSVPDPYGSYRTMARTDADIYFWRRWQEAGNTLYVDPLCAIGHLQPMVAVYGPDLKPKHQHVVDWRKEHKR